VRSSPRPDDDVSSEPPLVTVDEAARLLRVSRSLAYQLARRYLATEGSEGLPVFWVGACLRVPRWALLELIRTGRVVNLTDAARTSTPIDPTRPSSSHHSRRSRLDVVRDLPSVATDRSSPCVVDPVEPLPWTPRCQRCIPALEGRAYFSDAPVDTRWGRSLPGVRLGAIVHAAAGGRDLR
jgi:hypothetical protein